MYHSKIDEKELMQVRASDIKPGLSFYVKKESGFSHCIIEKDELSDFKRRTDLMWITQELSKKGLLYMRRDKGKSFVK